MTNRSSVKIRVHKLRVQPWVVYGIYALNLAIITWFWWRGSHLESGTLHGILTILGRYTGLVSAYAALWQLLLIGRMPVIKQAMGIEKELRLHRWNGYVAIYSLLAHIILLTAGYALALHVNLWRQFLDFTFNYPDMLKAVVGSILMIGLVVMSVVIVRRHLKYETWYLVHLSSYLAIVLAFGHQLSTGGDLIKQPGFEAYWQALYVIVFGLIALVRLALPLWTWWWQNFKVERVVEEAHNIYSIYVSGRHLDEFNFKPGQFAIWHFLSGPTGWQGHPFSFSTPPGGKYLRLTFKAVGDYTRTLPHVRPGTRVIIEGPFGKFTPDRRASNKVLLIAGGIGLTPIAAMLPTLTRDQADIVMVYAARSQKELALHLELDEQARKGVTLHYLTEDGSTMIKGRLDRSILRQLVPDVASREVFLCGPEAMMKAVTNLLVDEGVPPASIHTERFSLHSAT